MKQILFFIFIAFIANLKLSAQSSPVNRAAYQIEMKTTDSQIIIDGVFDEAAWLSAQKVSKFHMVLPTDEGLATSDSEVMMARDESNVYIAITCFDTFPGKRPVESLRRDFSFGKNDNFIVFIDTYNDQTNGFAFGISAVGAQWEGIQADGGFVSLNWDTKWKSAVKNYSDRWTAEFAIPYKSIRYQDGATEWGINFTRLDLKSGEKSAWAPVPRQFQTANLAFTGTVKWEEPLPKRVVNYAAIPYVFAQSTNDLQTDEGPELKAKVGLDAKITVSTSLNLDLTLNPDFSQVEVDQQQINLDRFELFFPERRQFFLENSDLFASLGNADNRPFFSRRIGLNNPVRGGARLSGKINKKSRIGLMNIQTGGNETIAASNFSVGVVQRQIFARSNISLFMVNKQVTDKDLKGENKYNRIAGVDINLSNANSRWTGKLFYHQAIFDGDLSDAFTFSGKAVYDTPIFSVSMSQSYIGSDYNAEVGYIRRNGIYNFTPALKYRFFPKGRSITTHGPNLDMNLFLDKAFDLRDRVTKFSYNFTWLDRSTFQIGFEETYIKLIRSFDPTNSGGERLPEESEHNWQRFDAQYVSNPRSLLNYTFSIGLGGYYNGTRSNFGTELSYRVQPYGYFGIIGSYNIINLPSPYNSTNFTLFGPKLDITFTDKIFLTTFTQYNDQMDNINVNVRFQWRFAPGSDFFIVFTQNSFADEFTAKDRGLVGKISYWFN